MTNEELRARLWDVERELAQWQQGLHFKQFKSLAQAYTDEQGKVRWDVVEQSLGHITMTARRADEQ
jgi:hypothetical protein